MENWKTEDSVDSLEVSLKNRRSVVLVVVCILTWIGCGAPFILKSMAFFNADLSKAFMGADSFSGTWFFLDWLVFPALCTCGAILMFLLKRWGFWIYCLGQLPPLGYSVYSIVVSTASLGSGLFFGCLWNGLSIAFIVIYAIEMNKLSRKPISTDF